MATVIIAVASGYGWPMANPTQARADDRQPPARGSSRRPAAGPRPDAVAAMRLARRTFQNGGKIDMQTIAAELGVDRTTLYRWVGNREVLLGDVLWSVGAPTWRNALDAMTLEGPAGVAEAMGFFVQALIDSAPLRTFLRAEPERALRLLTTKASVVQREMVASVERLLKQEEGPWSPESPACAARSRLRDRAPGRVLHLQRRHHRRAPRLSQGPDRDRLPARRSARAHRPPKTSPARRRLSPDPPSKVR